MRYLKMTMSKSDWLQLYKKECRKYFTYDAQLKKTKLDLKETIIEIENVRSPLTDRVGGHQIISQEERLIALIEVKEETEHQIDFYQSMIDWIVHVNNKVTSPAYRAITWQTLIQAKNRTDLMINYDVDPDYVCKMRDKFLNYALDDDSIHEYYDVMKKKSLSKWLSVGE